MIEFLEKSDLTNLKTLLHQDKPLLIIKNFFEANFCHAVKEKCHQFTKIKSPTVGNIYTDTFYQVDVFPSKVQTNRVFRSFHFAKDDGSEAYKFAKAMFSKLEEFQKQFVVPDENVPENFRRFWQIIHYPRGGGFFDWHSHPRYPVNYGLIVNLSKKYEDFNSGQTEFKVNDSIVKIDDCSNSGDLVLFRFDLVHRVAPCDPEQDLSFSSDGRWTAVLPILEG